MFFEIDDYNAVKAALSQMCDVFRSESVPESSVFDCKLVAKELLSNALRYGGGSARFAVKRTGNEIRISVKSADEFQPPAVSVCSDVTAECGRGLYLVDALCAARLYSREEGICVIIKIAE